MLRIARSDSKPEDAEARTTDFLSNVPGGLERRLSAAVIDMMIVSAGCFTVLQAHSAVLPLIVGQAGVPAAVLLGVLFALEALTGRSPGKLINRLRVNRIASDRENIDPAPVLQTLARAAVRWIAPAIALSSMLTADLATAGLLVSAAMAIVICEIPACYISLFRRGGTIFDLIARTRLASS
jgi:uncharacterized RDD family membrane protein YckC